MRHSLEGMRVISLSSGAAGPVVGKYLADFGATVIKVESVSAPDLTRVSGPFKEDKPGLNRSAAFELVNSSQYSVTLNLKKPKALDIARRLVAWTDIVIEGFAPGTIKSLGLSYEALKQIKQDIIMLSTTLKGQTGPQASLRGWGHQAFAEAGYIDFIGWPDRPGVMPQNLFVDYEGAWYGVIAVLAAFDYKRRTGEGQHIDLSQTEVGISFLATAILEHEVNNVNPMRKGNMSDRAAPHNAYRCRGEDKWCAIAAFTDGHWEAICRVIGKPELAKDPRFNTLPGRLNNRDEIDKLLEEWTVNIDALEVMAQMQSEGVPAGKVQSADDLLDSDPQLRHRHFWWEVNPQEMGLFKIYGSPAKLSKTPNEIRSSPRMGEHNYYVCTNFLGMSDGEFADLVNTGIFE